MKEALAIIEPLCEELDLSRAEHRETFVYLLVANGAIVYVGQATNVGSRVSLHRAASARSRKSFDRVLYFKVSEEDASDIEGALIRCLRPSLCRRAPKYNGRDNEILDRLGLPRHSAEEVAWFVANKWQLPSAEPHKYKREPRLRRRKRPAPSGVRRLVA